MPTVRVKDDKNVQYTEESINSKYVYRTTHVTKKTDGNIIIEPKEIKLCFRTLRKQPKCGLMMVGLGGNNGTTVTAAVLAHKHDISWRTKSGVMHPNYYGSITQSSTMNVGMSHQHHNNATMEEVFVPLKDLVPMINPTELVIGGWDCNGMNLGDAMRRAQVFDITLQDQLYPYMKEMKPLPAIFNLDFVAANQKERANNILSFPTLWEYIDKIRGDISHFKKENQLDKVIVVWTANTERFSDHLQGIHDTADHLLSAIKNNEKEIAPSLLYCVAAVLEGCSFINGAPQNTFCPGVIELAKKHRVFLGGDDFKSGQTKIKSALIEFFVAAGIKPECIASYNHLGNNDGYNLTAPKQFRSKEISKSNVVDDMVKSNQILYPPTSSSSSSAHGESEKEKKQKGPDHCIVIKYLPFVGDSKRAMDEYSFSIFMGGSQTIVLHNTCQDSLLASPLIIDLVVLTELMERVYVCMEDGSNEVCEEDDETGGESDEKENKEKKDEKELSSSFVQMDTILSVLSYLLKAPCVPEGTPVINALNRQKQAIENILRALVGLPPDNNMLLECRLPFLQHMYSSNLSK